MSLELLQSTGGRPAMDLLLHLDLESERLEQHDAGASVAVGPFQAFRVHGALPESSPPHSSEDADHVPDEVPTHHGQVDGDLFPDNCDVDDILNIYPVDHDDTDLFLQQPSPGHPFPELDMAMAVGPVVDHCTDVMTIPPAMPSGGSSHGHSLPSDASFILRYCRANTKTSDSRIRVSPWEKAFMPCAVETFGELTLWNTTSCSRFTVFYAVLAATAFRIHRSNPSASDLHWLNSGRQYQMTAKKFLKEALRTEVAGPSQGTYHELLLAVLSMATASVGFLPL